MNYQHIVLTRFAVKQSGSGFSGSFSEDWLANRFRLFERYCLPTMQGQSNGNFHWLIFVHGEFDEHLEKKLVAYDHRIQIVRPGKPGLGALISPSADVIATTRLDSDDGLNREAIDQYAAIARKFCAEGRDILLHNFPRGCKLDEKSRKAYLAWKPNSAFLTLFERPRSGKIRSVMSGSHSTLWKKLPTIQDDSMRAWLMVVHGSNVLNDIYPVDEMTPTGDIQRWFDLPFDPTDGSDLIRAPDCMDAPKPVDDGWPA